MRLLLQQKPSAGEAPKYVQLMLQQDLLGGWTLLRETGQIGGRSTLKREQYADQGSALAALESARDAGVIVTDESMAMEHQGLRPLLVEGREDNLKITTAADLDHFAFLLARRALEA